MFFLLSKILDTAFSPLSWAMVLIAAGTALALRKPTRRRVWGGLLGGGLAVLYFFSIEPVANALWRSLESPPLTTLRSEVTYDAVILLGGMVEVHATEGRDQIAFNDNVERMLATYDLLRTGRAQRVIISGGSPDPGSVFALEATSVARQLEAWGIAKERIVVESRARNTHENAVESARLARENGWKSLLVVTSAFHMSRALGCFRAVGLEVDSLAVDLRSYDPARHSGSLLPRSDYLAMSTDALREYAGQWIYRARGYAR